MISHDLELLSMSAAVDKLQLDRVGKVVFKHQELGILFGNGNHTDYWVVRIVRVDNHIETAKDILKARSKSIGLYEISIESASAAIVNDDMKSAWERIGVYHTYKDRNDIIVIQHFGLDAAGSDPRSH